ncbi:hypothetical protein MTO96_029134 [Rhipicephalus appendiculatus]
MNTLVVLATLSTLVAAAFAGGLVGVGYGLGGGYGGGGYGLGYGGGVGGVGLGGSVVLLNGGHGGYGKVVAGPSFLVKTVHHVNKISGGGAVVAHSGLGGGYVVGPSIECLDRADT